MRQILIGMAVCFATLIASAGLVQAEDSCNWNRQPNGTYFGVCVSNAGSMYCVSCPSKSSTNPACSRVSCK